MPRPRSPETAGRSPAARNLAEWCRQVSALLHLARSRGPYSPAVRASRERLAAELVEHARHHAPFSLRVTPLEIFLRDQLLLRVDREGGADEQAWERELPFLLYRDGVRAVGVERGLPHEEALALLTACVTVGCASLTHDDVVTLLWEARPTALKLESAPLRDVIEFESPAETLSSSADLAASSGEGEAARLETERREVAAPPEHAPTGSAWIDRGTLPDFDTRPGGGPGESHFDDWYVPGDVGSTAAQLWRELHIDEEAQRDSFRERLEAESKAPFAHEIEGFVSELRDLDPRQDTRDTIGASLVTWLASAVQRCDWVDALNAHDALRALDPSGDRTNESVASALQSLDARAIAERLDEDEPAAQARFFALAVSLGAPALDLMIGILARASRPRVRAGMTTALSYACADTPGALVRFLSDSRWFVVRNVVFTLGAIGGEAVVGALGQASRHLDARVRRAAVQALGQVPARHRTPLLLAQLDTSDPATFAQTLAMLARERDARTASALLERITSVDFDARPEEARTALLATLSDVADDRVLPALEQLLVKGGWFARRTAERTAVARTLARIGTPAARAVLEAHRDHRAEAVRSACRVALAEGIES